LSSLTLQHFQIQGPFFSLAHSCTRLRSFALLRRSSALRVWLPSRRLQSLSPLGDLLSQHSWASPFRAFLLSHGRIGVSASSSPLRCFPRNPCGLLPALQRLTPMKKAGPLFAPQRVRSGQGLVLSWAFWPLGSSRQFIEVRSFAFPSLLPLLLF
jgi:hypothetical protein